MTVNWTHGLVEQLDWHWRQQLRPRLDGLTDDEYHWEPVAGCWGIRPAGDGTFTGDYTSPEPAPPPFTTIAWRLGHIATSILGMRAANHFGNGSFDIRSVRWPGTAAEGLAFVDGTYDDWITGVRGLDDDRLAHSCGPAEGPFADYPFAALVLHINREVIHHGAEIACLRDLYRDRHR